jgi:hypothetical protein
MAKEKIGITGLTILAVLIAIYFVNQICTLIFVPLLVITIIAFLIAIFVSFINFELSFYFWVGFFALLILTIISYSCGTVLANSELGAALIQAGNASNTAIKTLQDAENTAERAVKNASKEVIDATMNSTDIEDPNLKKMGDIAKTVIDLS